MMIPSPYRAHDSLANLLTKAWPNALPTMVTKSVGIAEKTEYADARWDQSNALLNPRGCALLLMFRKRSLSFTWSECNQPF